MHVITDASEEILATYNLCLIGPTPKAGQPTKHMTYMDLVARVLPEYMKATEEDLTDLLPAGYRVQIKEWDSE